MHDIEHPSITRVRRTGYPNIVIEPQHAEIDYYGLEILEGDEIFEYDGDIVLKENLDRFLIEELGFGFKIAK